VIKVNPESKDLITKLFKDLDSRFFLTFGEEEEEQILRNYNKTLIVRLDSDDMYEKDAIKLFRKAATENSNEFFLCTEGFIHNTTNGVVKRYDPPGSTPFHARRVDGQKFPFLRIGKQHRRIKFLNPFYMEKNLYMINVHEHNTSTRMDLATGKVRLHKQKDLLKEFGV
jgi:hypothetical protein